jgi:GNAT superfamily N-acetyltransferase
MMNVAIRRATLDDVAVIIKQRRAMFDEMKKGTAEQLEAMSKAYAVWLPTQLRAGRYIGWLAVERELVFAGAGVWFYDWQPTPYDSGGQGAYILNVYTDLRYRGRGIARQLVERTLDTCRQQGICKVHLHASIAGKTLYRKMGFQSSNEMTILLEPSD